MFQLRRGLRKLRQSRFQVVNDLGGDDVGRRQRVGIGEALVLDPEQVDSRDGEVGLVAGNDREAMAGGGCCNQTVNGWDVARPSDKATSLVCDIGVNRKNAVVEPARQRCFQPSDDPGTMATTVHLFDALADFAERQDTDEQGLGLRRVEPVEDQARRFGLGQFRECAGVDQEARRSMSRGGDRSRLMFRSIPASGDARSSSASEDFGRFRRS